MVGYIPERDGAAFKRRMRDLFGRAGYDTVRSSRDPHGEDWYLHVKHRLRREERLLIARHDRSGLRRSLWCYIEVDLENDKVPSASPL